ncbi:MAG: NUDIX domain-containing protein [Bdellovibrionota bacterium]
MSDSYRKALVVIVWSPEPGSPEKKVLLLKLLESRGGFWQTVTGGVEKKESFAKGALREAEEETGLPFTRQPQFLGLEQKFVGRHGAEAQEHAFFLPLFGGAAPPTPKLDGKEHTAFEWVTPAEAAKRVKYPFNAAAIERAAAGLPPLLLTKRGAFFQEGEEITHENTARLFHRSLRREADGHYTVHCEGESLDVILEDNPRYVLAYSRDKGEIRLSDGSTEVLDPGSLRVRPDNSLVCTVSNGWPATFLSAAYYDISRDVAESGPDQYVLNFLGRRYDLRIAP